VAQQTIRSGRAIRYAACVLAAMALTALAPILGGKAARLGLGATPAHAAVTPMADRRSVAYNVQDGGSLWAEWSSNTGSQLDTDFSAIAGLGANDVRIFVGTSETGPSFPSVSPGFQSELATVVSKAASHGLTVQLSIFNRYFPATWPYPTSSDPAVVQAYNDDVTWMNNVLAPYLTDTRLSSVDLRNEIPIPNCDPVPGDTSPERWASAILLTLEGNLNSGNGGIPVLMSTRAKCTESGLQTLQSNLTTLPTVYGFHYYDVPGLLYGRLTYLKSVLQRPVYIQESGYSTSMSNMDGGTQELAATPTVRQAYQARYFATVAAATYAAGLGAPGLWVFQDTTSSDTYQADFGLFSVVGGVRSAKPAVQAVQSMFNSFRDGTPLRGPDINASFDDPNQGAPASLPSPWEDHLLTTVMDAEPARTGTHDACGSNTSQQGYFYEYLPVVGPLSGTYSMGAFAFEGSTSTLIGFNWLGLDGNPIGPEILSPRLPGTELSWTQISTGPAIAPPAGAIGVKVFLYAQGMTCFDDISFPL
jgi:hypothetical protein